MQLKLAKPPASALDLGVDNERPLSQLNQFLSNLSRQEIMSMICPKNEDSFYVCDLGQIARQVNLWRSLLPRVLPFYAVKCNDDTQLLKLLAGLGLGFDCASKGEISRILSIGVAADRIIYANPCKQSSHVKYAASNNVDLMTFDSEGELYKLKKSHPNASLILRIATDDSQSICQLGMKFGAPLHRCDELLKIASEIGSTVVGVSFHVGSGCLDARAYQTAIENAAHVFKKGIAMGFDFTVLDIGGGFPGFDPNGDSPSAPFEEIAQIVNDALDKHVFSLWPAVTVIAEPGRFLAAAAFTLTAGVISIKPGNEDDSKKMCYISDGVYGSFNCLLYDHAKVTPQPFEGCDGKATGKFSVWGPTCDGLDKIADECELPESLDAGDWLVFENMGAYTMAAASTFNGFAKPTVHHFISHADMKLAQRLVRKPLSVHMLTPSAAESSDEEDVNNNVDNSQLLEDLFSNLTLPVISI